MLTFTITDEERRRAQDRAAELDVARSTPSGRPPYLWGIRLNSVIRWYDYGSRENKIGVIHFERIETSAGEKSERADSINCTTELFHRPLDHDQNPQQLKITDSNEHWQLFALFRAELLGDA